MGVIPRGVPEMKLIVHGTDGSTEARAALDLAIDLAKDAGASLAVVSVHTIAPGAKGLRPAISEVEHLHGAEHLAEEAAAKAREAGIETRAYAVTGEPAKAIAELADELGADLIVVGSRGFGPLHGALVGSVSRGLMARTKVPVTVVTQRGVREPARV
jgi:nucleotide-binding universal stress UspA family protein